MATVRYDRAVDPSNSSVCMQIAPEAVIATVTDRQRVRQFDMAVLRSSSKDIVSRHIFRRGHWEITHPSEMAALAQVKGVSTPMMPHALPDGSPPILLDIGANLGFYTLLFAHYGFRVIAIEPMERNRRLIQTSLCLNPRLIGRVTLVPVALVASAKATTSCIVRTAQKGGAGNGELVCGAAANCSSPRPDFSCNVVTTRTLDSLLEELRPPAISVAKIDIEGGECNALRGGQSLLTRYRPAFIQWEGLHSKVVHCMRHTVRARGYRVGERHGTDLNTVATPREASNHRL